MGSRNRTTPLWVLLVIVLALGVLNHIDQQTLREAAQTQAGTSDLPVEVKGVPASDFLLVDAFRRGRSDIFLSGEGRISRLLPDDTKGSRHQRILVQLEVGQTVLLVHNIDLAPRIENPVVGEPIEFFGEYVWNQKGGLIHWTHHDPKHPERGGWIRYDGRVYR